MNEFLKKELGVTRLEEFASRDGGWISEGKSFHTEKGDYYVKLNGRSGAKTMFEGEGTGLRAILQTGTIRCPKPLVILDHPDGPGSIFVMEHLGHDLRDLDQHAELLGEQVARLHLHNRELTIRAEKRAGRVGMGVSPLDEGEGREEPCAVTQFGFHATTCCGYYPLDNTWCDDWVTFFTRQLLKSRIDIIERDYSDRKVRELWAHFPRVIPGLFKGLGPMTPALLHGDLHGANVAEIEAGPVIYDPACVYGHHEFELAITRDFVEFNQEFFPSYHRLIPEQPGFKEREKLYRIYCFFNHWIHFGPEHRDTVISLMTELVSRETAT